MRKTATNTKKKAALYCRVSTYDQTKGDFTSNESQEEQLRHYCEFKKWDIYEIYIDDGKSAATIQRPAFQHLISAAKDRQFDVLLSTKLDRISRNNRDWYKLIEDFESYGVEIAVLDPQLDTTTAIGRMVRDILIAFAQFERELTKERTYEKMHTTAKRGMWTGGIPPIGYSLNEKVLVPIDEYKHIIKMIFTDTKDGIKPSIIARLLNNEGIRTSTHITKTGKVFGGRRFNTNTISKILINPVYAGKTIFNNEIFDGLHEKIISYKLWKECEKIRKPLKKPRKGTGKLMLLTGLLECGCCGATLTTAYTKKQNKIYFYYQCTSVQKFGREACVQKNINASSIESLVKDICFNLAQDSKYIEASLTTIQKKQQTEVQINKKELTSLDGKINALKQQIDNIVEAIKSGGPKSVINRIKTELEELENQNIQLKEKRVKLKLIKNGLQQSLIDLDQVAEYFKAYNKKFDKLERDSKRKIINILIENIVIKAHHKEKEGTIKIKPRNLAAFNIKSKNLKSLSFDPQLLRRRD